MKRATYFRLPVFIIVFCMLLPSVSCTRVPGKLLVMEGNFFNARGMHSESAAPYFRALKYGDAAPYAEYGLGSGYLALDERKAALERFAAAEEALGRQPSANRELLYRIRYNRGIILFGDGDYRGAAAAFREALEADGRRLEAKRNLELSLLSAAMEIQGNKAPLSEGGGTDGSEMEVLFNYLRQKERSQWESREWKDEDPPSGPDY